MKFKLMRIAFATISDKGLEDNISHEFGRSKTFTIVDIEENKVKDVKIIQNPASMLTYGKGPIVAKHLSNIQVSMVVSSEFGPGVSVLLDEFGIKKLIAKPGQKVIDVLKERALIS